MTTSIYRYYKIWHTLCKVVDKKLSYYWESFGQMQQVQQFTYYKIKLLRHIQVLKGPVYHIIVG